MINIIGNQITNYRNGFIKNEFLAIIKNKDEKIVI